MTVQILRPSNFRSKKQSPCLANEMQSRDQQRQAFLHDYARNLVLEHRQAVIFQRLEREEIDRPFVVRIEKCDTECGSICKIIPWRKNEALSAPKPCDEKLLIDFENAVVETLLSRFEGFLKSMCAEAEA